MCIYKWKLCWFSVSAFSIWRYSHDTTVPEWVPACIQNKTGKKMSAVNFFSSSKCQFVAKNRRLPVQKLLCHLHTKKSSVITLGLKSIFREHWVWGRNTPWMMLRLTWKWEVRPQNYIIVIWDTTWGKNIKASVKTCVLLATSSPANIFDQELMIHLLSKNSELFVQCYWFNN